MTPGKGLILAAPSSGCGKTTITLGLLRNLARDGETVRGAKSGPDYIDPCFHSAASGAPCVNLDAWAMQPDRLRALASGPGLLLIEGAMGLFDGAPPEGKGATADLARHLGLPVVLIVDAGRMAQSVAPLVAGFAQHAPDVRIAGVILNRVGSARHERLLRLALETIGIPVIGAMPRLPDLATPSRHLGLVQAEERDDLEAFLDRAADHVGAHVDLAALRNLARPVAPRAATLPLRAPPAQRIAVAEDVAFRFSYPHMLSAWRAMGAEISSFSPLADDPVPDAGFVFLPGGYPELHAGRIAQASRFLGSLQRAAEQGVEIYGECGGYMVLGDGLVDGSGNAHPMAGLLRLETSMAKPKLHLGYRTLTAHSGCLKGRWFGHEFHYASTVKASGTPLFDATDAEQSPLTPMGLQNGSVSGSFAHLIESAALPSAGQGG